mgnify:CR=1 FL=1
MAPGCRRSSSSPAQIKGALRNWRSGFGTEIGDRRVNVIQGNLGTNGVATLCFDAQTGLLLRMIRYGPSPVGRIVTRVDYTRLPRRWHHRRQDAVQMDGELA